MPWRLILPTIQIIVTAACMVYDPIQYHNLALRAKQRTEESVTSTRMFVELSPPPISRFSYVNSLPAFVVADLTDELATSFGIPTPAWRYTTLGSTPPWPVTYLIGIREISFLIAVALLWYWVGGKIESLKDKSWGSVRPSSRVWQIVELVVVFLMGAYLLVMGVFLSIAPKVPPPYRQIATFGLIWPAVLLAYFVLCLRQEFRISPGKWDPRHHAT
jgi:hypothetical protein